MLILKSFDDIYREDNSFVTIGTFDGVHLAHQEIVKNVVSSAKSRKGRSVVVTFEPHPRLVLEKESKMCLLTTLNEKVNLLKEIGVDVLLVVDFTVEFAAQTPYNFFTKLIYDKVGVRELIVGYDHGFGKDRSGNIDILKMLGQHLNFKIDIIEPIKVENERISSTKIRGFLLNGEIDKANLMLGRNYEIYGEIVIGDRRGRMLGFPTANIKPDDEKKLIPKRGVYFVEIEIEKKLYYGMMNIGIRPTFDSSENLFIETHIFNLNEDIYEKSIKVKILKFIREEKKFESAQKLIEQLNKDKEECFKFLKN